MTLRTQELFRFMHERYQVYRRSSIGKPKPWTENPILQRYRFTNVYREDDKVTGWLRAAWYAHQSEPDYWFAMAVARHVNWPDTLGVLGYPVPWDGRRFAQVLEKLQRDGHQVFGGAYMINARGMERRRGKPMYRSKAHYLAVRVLGPMWRRRKALQPRPGDTLQSFAARLLSCYGLSGFMAGQVIADAKYGEESVLFRASDWWTWAISGPGSRRGLNRVLQRPVAAGWREEDWLLKLHTLHTAIAPLLQDAGMPRMHAQDLQNCLCEFDKYERVRMGQGRPRANYPGLPEPWDPPRW